MGRYVYCPPAYLPTCHPWPGLVAGVNEYIFWRALLVGWLVVVVVVVDDERWQGAFPKV